MHDVSGIAGEFLVGFDQDPLVIQNLLHYPDCNLVFVHNLYNSLLTEISPGTQFPVATTATGQFFVIVIAAFILLACRHQPPMALTSA